MSGSAINEPPPKLATFNKRNIGDLVLDDIKNRIEMGEIKYGTKLQAFNGRNALWDAYQEAIDLCMYLRQLIEEDNTR